MNKPISSAGCKVNAGEFTRNLQNITAIGLGQSWNVMRF